MHQCRRRGEPHTESPLASRQSQRQTDVSLPRPTVSERQHVLPPPNPLAARQLHYQLFVQRWHRNEVVRVEALAHRELRGFYPPFGGAPLAVQYLLLDQPQ